MCSVGEYSPYNADSCLPCPKGYKCPGPGMVAPILCESGYYNNAERQASCSMCEGGRSCANRNGSEICPAGTYSPPGVLECLPCSTGNYSKSGSTACLICPSGKSCSDPSKDPEDCPKGYYSHVGDGTCTICPVGSQSFANGTDCLPCNPGYYCPSPR